MFKKPKSMAYGPITSWQIDGENVERVTDFIFLGSKITVDSDCSHEILKTLSPWEKSYDKPRQHIKRQRYHFANKGLYRQSYSFSSSRERMWELDHKERWVPKNQCFWTVVLEKTLESPLDCKEIKPVNSFRIFNPEYSLEGLVLKLKIQPFGHLMLGTRLWSWGRLRAGGEGGDRGWISWMVSLIQWTWAWANSGR